LSVSQQLEGTVPAAVGVTVTLLYLARLRDAFGRSKENVTLAAGSSVDALLDALRARGEPWSRELAAARAFRVAVNHDVVGHDAMLGNGDEVALLPPVSGG
jgi:molybdopterin synthase sulfur carrier subunit